MTGELLPTIHMYDSRLKTGDPFYNINKSKYTFIALRNGNSRFFIKVYYAVKIIAVHIGGSGNCERVLVKPPSSSS